MSWGFVETGIQRVQWRHKGIKCMYQDALIRLLLLIDSNLQVEFSGFLSRLAHVTNPQPVSHRQSLIYPFVFN